MVNRLCAEGKTAPKPKGEKTMKMKWWNVLLCVLLGCVMAFGSVSALASEESLHTVVGEWIELPTLETSSRTFSFFTLDGNGNVALKDGNYQKWIDRVDLTDGEYATSLYAWLEANSDVTTGTGALIDPTTQTQLSSGEYVYLVTTIKGEGTFAYTGNSAVDDQTAFDAVADQVYANEAVAFSYITAAYSAFDRDHPEVFWLSGESQMLDMISYGYNSTGRVTFTQRLYFLLQSSEFDIRGEAYRDADEVRSAISALYGENGAVETILSGVDAGASRYEKVKYFDDWLTKHNCYNGKISAATKDAFECISALTGATGTAAPVCEGYARAMKVLCDRTEIPCVLVDGMADLGGYYEAHMWNYVCMDDGNWYGVDSTWDDPAVSGISSPVSGFENQNYLLVGSDTKIGAMTFIQSHPVSNVVTVNGTSFSNGPQLSPDAYEPADPATVPTLTGSSFSLSFEDEILVNFYYNGQNMDDVVEQGMLVFYDDPGVADFTMADDIYSGSDGNDAVFLNTTTGIAAKYMGDSRYYCAYAKLSDGTYAYSKLYQYSPKKYATNMLGKDSTSAAQKALCVAMLNYGAAAQNYFGYKTDDLMNAALTEEQKALVVAYDAGLFKGAVAADASKTLNFLKSAEGFTGRSATVSFEGAFSINYYFAPSEAPAGDLTLYYWTPEAYAAADVLTVDNASGSMAMVDSGNGTYWGQVSGIAAKNLDDTYYVAGVYTDDQGNTYCTGVIAYSLSRYCLNNAKDGKDMQELAANTAMYGHYAKAYFMK